MIEQTAEHKASRLITCEQFKAWTYLVWLGAAHPRDISFRGGGSTQGFVQLAAAAQLASGAPPMHFTMRDTGRTSGRCTPIGPMDPDREGDLMEGYD